MLPCTIETEAHVHGTEIDKNWVFDKDKVCVLIPCRTEFSVDEVVDTDRQEKLKQKKVKLKI